MILCCKKGKKNTKRNLWISYRKFWVYKRTSPFCDFVRFLLKYCVHELSKTDSEVVICSIFYIVLIKKILIS